MPELSSPASPVSKAYFPAAPPEVELSILDIALYLHHRRRMLLIWTLCGLFAGLVLAFAWPKRYTAQVTFMPPSQSGSMSSAFASQLGALGSLASLGGLPGLKSPADLYTGLLKTETVENAMIAKYGLMAYYHDKRMSDGRKDFEKHVDIDSTGKDGLVRVSIEANSPERAAEIANGYIEQLRHLSQSLAIGEASQRRSFLEGQLEQGKNNLAAAEEELKKAEQKSGVIEVTGQARALIESAAGLRAQVAAKEVEVQSIQSYSGPGNVQLIEAQQELAGLRAQLEKLNSNGNAAGDGNGLLQSRGELPEAGLEYVRRLREVKYQETLFEILSRQYEVARLDEAREGAMIQVVDPATPPDRKSWPPRALFCLAGAALGFLAAVSALALREARIYLRAVQSSRPAPVRA